MRRPGSGPWRSARLASSMATSARARSTLSERPQHQRHHAEDHLAGERPAGRRRGQALLGSAMRVSVPPSPLLSARMIRSTYLSVTTMMLQRVMGRNVFIVGVLGMAGAAL